MKDPNEKHTPDLFGELELKINLRRLTREEYNRALAELEPDPNAVPEVADGNEDSTSPFERPENFWRSEESEGG